MKKIFQISKVVLLNTLFETLSLLLFCLPGIIVAFGFALIFKYIGVWSVIPMTLYKELVSFQDAADIASSNLTERTTSLLNEIKEILEGTRDTPYYVKSHTDLQIKQLIDKINDEILERELIGTSWVYNVCRQ